MIWRKNNKWDEKNNNKLYERETNDNASKVIAICSNYKRMAKNLLIIKDKVVIQTLLK